MKEDLDTLVPLDRVERTLKELRFTQCGKEGRLMLVELMSKAAAGYYNSHTEELFLNSFDLMKKDRTPNKDGRRFMCEMIYDCSNRKPELYYLADVYRV